MATQEQDVRMREETAVRALEAYRERRRRRRAEDTYFGSSECLLTPAEAGAPEGDVVRRRIEIIEDAQEAGMSAGLAELLYDIAREEGLDPAVAYELVRSGLGVAPPQDGVANASEQPVTDKYVPGWLMQPPSTPDELLRERMLRLSFRRLRALLEEHEDPAEAFRAFAREPDVGHFGY